MPKVNGILLFLVLVVSFAFSASSFADKKSVDQAIQQAKIDITQAEAEINGLTRDAKAKQAAEGIDSPELSINQEKLEQARNKKAAAEKRLKEAQEEKQKLEEKGNA